MIRRKFQSGCNTGDGARPGARTRHVPRSRPMRLIVCHAPRSAGAHAMSIISAAPLWAATCAKHIAKRIRVGGPILAHTGKLGGVSGADCIAKLWAALPRAA